MSKQRKNRRQDRQRHPDTREPVEVKFDRIRTPRFSEPIPDIDLREIFTNNEPTKEKP